MEKKTYKHVYQFKVYLKKIKPIIWRRIEVPENYTFWGLHCAIQDAMGWLDYHLHEFEVKDPRIKQKFLFGIPMGEYEMEMSPSWEEKIANFFTMENRKANYLYDLGDFWEHIVRLDEIHPAQKDTQYPRCVSGKRAAPPEDCGGISGYEQMIEILLEPQHEEYDSYVKWLGEVYDPEEFNPSKIIFSDPAQRLDNLFNIN